ncbi:hypothetical protein N9N67_02155 [Bacteriovoracaceae bacterium]|nr:hypothetical protein [Bacteriovoracaceae bacterium]
MKIYLCLSFLLINLAIAWETDNFSTRAQLLKQSREKVLRDLHALNDHTNQRIKDALKQFNRRRRNRCKPDMKRKIPLVTKLIHHAIGAGFSSTYLEAWVEKNIKTLPIINPIYKRGWTPRRAFNFANTIIGSDKIDHMINMGFKLFQKYKKRNLEKALQLSDLTEEIGGPYGLTVSGIKSYGDLAANFAGIYFYTNLTNGPNSHLGCDRKSNKYYLNEPVNWADYIHHSWDQGINCSLFTSLRSPLTKSKLNAYISENKEVNSSMYQKFTKNLDSLFENIYTSEDYKDLGFQNSCPLVDTQCEELIKINCAQYIVSPRCHSKYPSLIDSLKCYDPAPGERFNTSHSFSDYRFEE